MAQINEIKFLHTFCMLVFDWTCLGWSQGSFVFKAYPLLLEAGTTAKPPKVVCILANDVAKGSKPPSVKTCLPILCAQALTTGAMAVKQRSKRADEMARPPLFGW